MTRSSDNKLLLLLFFVLAFSTFYNLNALSFFEWDESRHGVNAIEMLNNGDYINLFYAGEKDDWNLKPPLAIWAIALSFNILGISEFALRLPSAIAIILATFFLFKIIRLYKDVAFAFFTCLILATVQGWMGYHVGRTGDTDAMLLLFLMMNVYYYLKYLDFENKKSIALTGITLGLAFLVKGPTMLIYLPGMLLYPLLTNRFKNLIQRKEIYWGAICFLIFPIGWFTLVHFYGISFSQKEHLGDNTFDSMFIYDIIERFSNPNFEHLEDPRTNWFFFTYLDARFNIWNYFSYVGVLFSVFYFLKKEKNILAFFQNHRLLLISILFAFPLCLFMTLAVTQRHWYLAPALPFIAILTFGWIDWMMKKHSYFKYLFFIVLVYAMLNRFNDLNKTSTISNFVIENCSVLTSASKIIVSKSSYINQDLMLYLYSCNRNITFISQLDQTVPIENENVIFIKKEDFKKINQQTFYQNISVVKDDGFIILKKK